MKLFFKKIGEGKPLIILHGLFGLGDNLMTAAKAIALNGFGCYLVDQRNHGRSPNSNEFNYEVMAEDIAELMRDENINTADFIGHSLGGKTAMFFAKAFPEKVGKVIIVDIAPRFYPQHHQSILEALKSFNPAEISSRKEAEEILRGSIRDESTIQFFLKNLSRKKKEVRGITSIESDTEESDEENDISEGFEWRFGLQELDENIEEVGKEFTSEKELETNILFLRGEKSGYVSEEDITSIKNIFPKAKIETIANAGHWVHAEQSESFIESCLAFLKN